MLNPVKGPKCYDLKNEGAPQPKRPTNEEADDVSVHKNIKM